MTGYTSPNALPYPASTDYNDPADGPLTFQALAEAVQTALNTKAMPSTSQIGDSDVLTGPSSGGLAWDQYFPITAVLPTWSGAGAWAEFGIVPRAGTLEVHSMHYLECNGGTSAEITAFAGVQVLWSDGAGPADQQRPVLGRLTAPKATSLTVGVYSVLRLPNNPAKALRVRPSGQLAAAVAGGSARIGLSRVTLRLIPSPFTIPFNAYTSG